MRYAQQPLRYRLMLPIAALASVAVDVGIVLLVWSAIQ